MLLRPSHGMEFEMQPFSGKISIGSLQRKSATSNILMFDIMIITLRPMSPQQVQDSNSLTTMMLGVPGPGFTYSERDCLNLNVFAPRCVEHVPVICYIHGGRYGGNALPKNGTVAVNDVRSRVFTWNVHGLTRILFTTPQQMQQTLSSNRSPKEHQWWW